MENKVLFLLSNHEHIEDLVTHLELSEPPIEVEIADLKDLDISKKVKADVIVIDVNTIGSRSIILIQDFRRQNPYLPIIVLSEQDSPEVASYYFNMGVDDFVRKPYDIMELSCRIKAKIRVMNYIFEMREGLLQYAGPKGLVNIGEAKVDFDRMILYRDEKTFMLSPKQIGILRLLYINKGHVVPRSKFLKEIWLLEDEGEITDRVVDTNIVMLRKKIGDIGRQPKYIKTIFGIGYLLIDA